jgi:hypothetical protein
MYISVFSSSSIRVRCVRRNTSDGVSPSEAWIATALMVSAMISAAPNP